ncbi:MAG: homoserine dehydrogenase [Planctomycetota bacterium]|nr:homoserine dehydrogenase [Planctomycetota bacterium]
MNETSAQIGVAIVGCGTVGGATALLLTREAALLTERSGVQVRLVALVDKDYTNARRLGLSEALFRSDLEAVLADPGVNVVVELVGGTTIAGGIIEKALKAGKDVVTANKALLAHRGAELSALARAHGVSLAFEASCGGGIPIIRALTDGLLANRIDALYGIVNGTCNYILSEMTAKGRTYAQALAQAQRDGLAEADPTLDVAGIDSAHKLTILAGLAFGRRVNFDAIDVAGIDKLDVRDIRYGQELGYVVKLLAIARRQGDGLVLRVGPAFISRNHPLAWVSGPFNAVSVYGHATGHTMHYGRGAGGSPTASAVVADILSAALGDSRRRFAALRLWADVSPEAKQLPIDAATGRHYIRLLAADRPGVLAQIAAILGEHGISICSVLQPEVPGSGKGNGVPVIITTHEAPEGQLRAALAKVDRLETVKAPTVCIDIVDEHPEQR